jgi:hypothetical protein
LISRPNKPDFSDLFALSQAEYQKLGSSLSARFFPVVFVVLGIKTLFILSREWAVVNAETFQKGQVLALYGRK